MKMDDIIDIAREVGLPLQQHTMDGAIHGALGWRLTNDSQKLVEFANKVESFLEEDKADN